jgi:hypothetical protein
LNAALTTQLQKDAQARFVRWDAALWRDLLAGPAALLERTLSTAGADTSALVESYLRLASEGIGLGYLFPPTVGINFFTLAWTKLLPEGLALLPEPRRAEALAACWNLGENLESSPVWLRRIFLRLCQDGIDLGRLDVLVADVSRQALQPPSAKLEGAVQAAWLHLGAEDPRFLPGAAHFVAPTVACIHDRLRTAAGGRDAATMGVWLGETPLVLGPMGCSLEPPVPTPLPAGIANALARAEPNVREPFAGTANEWRAVVTLVTSQHAVAVRPA